MKDESSVFGAKSDNVDRLLQFGLEPPQAEEEPVPTASQDTRAEKPGDRIGRYKLLKILGEGGMGIIYLAQQEEPVRRRVALKIIKPGMDTKRVLARFEAERQALALLDHPNIAQVYDAGTADSGRPYFVMEYVKGTPITEFCDRHTLSIEDRLRLFQQVCQAVQHAHQKGIIHRDLKPSNILVTSENDHVVPKIIDFGVVKALIQPLTERTLVTEQGQLFGTPEYMSPEQADMVNEDIDTRSDVYSLGVLLYVLLTGVLPFDPQTLRDSGIENIRRTIRETDPKTPSTRLTELGEEAMKIAEMRRTQISTLAKHLKKELEWIPLKAMRKERAERYRSAADLADDIGNYLDGTPLMAGPLRTMYRLKKSVRRHRALFASAVTLLVVLTVGVVVSTIFAVGQARALSENQLIVDYLFMGVLQPLGRQSDRQLSVQDILDMATENLEGRFGKYPSTEAEIREWLGSIYVWGLDDYYAGADQLERSRNLAEKSGEQYGGSDALGWAYFRQGRYEEAAQQLEQVVGRRRQLSVPKPGGYFPWTHLASVYVAQGRYNEAEEVILETWKRHFPDNQDELSPNLGEIYLLQGRYEEAEAIYRKGIEDNRTDRFSWGFWYHRCGLAQLCTEQGRYEEANVLLTEVLDKARETHGAQQLWKLHCVNCLAVLRREQGQHGEAETLFLKALEGRRKLGEDHPDTLETLHELALLYKKQELYDRSAPLLEKAVKGRRLKLGDTHPHTLESVNHLIELYEAWGRPDQANKWRIKFP